MRAVAINEYGPSEKLTLVDLKEPSPRPDEVLIRVRAAGVNPVDWKIRSGMLKIVLWLKFPFIPGFDISGDVAAVGSRVTRFKPGDPVYAMLGPPRGGGYAELAVAPESAVVRKAHSQSYIEAASMPVAALTALQGLRDLGRLKPGQSVLINGASGGVGTFAVQIARALGARVTGVCGPKNVGLVRSLGAEMVLDYTKEDFTAPGKAYDVILDAVAKRLVCELPKGSGAGGDVRDDASQCGRPDPGDGSFAAPEPGGSVSACPDAVRQGTLARPGVPGKPGR